VIIIDLYEDLSRQAPAHPAYINPTAPSPFPAAHVHGEWIICRPLSTHSLWILRGAFARRVVGGYCTSSPGSMLRVVPLLRFLLDPPHSAPSELDPGPPNNRVISFCLSCYIPLITYPGIDSRFGHGETSAASPPHFASRVDILVREPCRPANI